MRFQLCKCFFIVFGDFRLQFFLYFFYGCVAFCFWDVS